MEHHHRLAAIVGDAHIHPAQPHDAIDGVAPQFVVTPGNAEEVAGVLCYATSADLTIAPRGAGSKIGWGNAPRTVDLLLSTGRLTQVVEHAWGDMTATVEAGCSIAVLQATLAEHGQRLALDPLWPERATVGGVLATNDSGALRVRFGALRDQVLGVTVALPDGTLARSGGKVVKNVAGYDLPKLMTGALGSLGVVVAATMRLYPLPRAERTLTFGAPDVAAADRLILAALDSPLVPTGMQLRLSMAQPPQVDVRFEGVDAALDEQVALLASMTGGLTPLAAENVWDARTALWHGTEPAVVCKVAVLPSQLAELAGAIERVARLLQLEWNLVAQAFGVGMLRLTGANDEALLAALSTLRGEIEAIGGSLVAVGCPPSVKARIDVWGAQGDDMPLMRRVKAQFDPLGILNPGRFVGGI